jgi:Holliday junction DNA helicase RuvA
VVIDVNGVGYLAFCSTRSAGCHRRLVARLLIETLLREDHIHLYGFATRQNATGFGC